MTNTYVTISGDTWDIIAYKTLENEMLKDKIMKANIDFCEYVVFPAGVTLTIPEIDISVSESLPPWKRGEEFE